MNYFIVTDDMQQGPFTIEQLRLLGITSDTLVWAEGMDAWIPAWQVEELRPLIYGGQAPSGRAVPVPPPPPVDSDLPSPQSPSDFDREGPGALKRIRSSHGTLFWTGIVVIALLIFMAVTNPSRDKHRMVIKENVHEGLSKAMADSDDDIWGQGLGLLGLMIADPLVNSALDNLLQYHNYVFFSSTSIKIGKGKPRTVSYGVFGRVFSSSGDAISEAMKKQMEAGTDSGSSSDVGGIFDKAL